MATRRGAFAARNAARAQRRYKVERIQGDSYRVVDDLGKVYSAGSKEEAQEHVRLLRAQARRDAANVNRMARDYR
jgi:hypothetical protein